MPRPTDPRLLPEDRIALAELATRDRAAYAEVITEYIDPVYLTLDIAGQFLSTKEMKFGDILVKKFKGKYNVQQIVPGQITLGQQITVRNKAMSYNLDILSAKASYNELELKNGGPQFTPETVRSDIRKALEEKILLRTWNALGNVWTTANAGPLTIPGSSNSNFLDATGALTSSVLDAAIDHVNFWTDGGVKAIIGTEQALAPLSTFGQYQLIGTTNDGYVTQNGTPAGTFRNTSPFGPGLKAVETYRGVTNIIRVKQILDKTEFPPVPLLPTDYVLVIGEDIGEFITYGGPNTKEWTDMEPTPPYWFYEIWQQFGMMIWNARGLVKIACTSVVP